MSRLNNKTFNISEIIKESPLPSLDIELLISFLLHKNREFILSRPETKISPILYKKFKILEAKRLKNWPLAYLTGQKEFYGLNFKVSPTVLTPRPETELIVDKIIESIKSNVTDKFLPFIIDLGTGSGAIIISVASEIKRLLPDQFKKINLAAVDISVSALKIAKQNAKAHEFYKSIKFYHGNLLAPLKLNKRKLTNREIIIAANLPYLTKAQIKKSPSIRHEPKLALDGGADGLKYYRELFKQLRDLKLSEIKSQILCEIDPSQSKKISLLAKRSFPAATLEITKDLAQKNRLLIINRN